MSSLLLQQSSLRAVDCVVKSTDFLTDATIVVKRLSGGTLEKVNDSDGSHRWYKYQLDYTQTFSSKGSACITSGNYDSYYFSVFAKQADGQRLDPRYLSVQNVDQPTVGKLDVYFDYRNYGSYDSVAHAVYVVAQNQVDPRSTNWYCFMITNCPEERLTCTGAANLCQKYCTVERTDPFARNEINYIAASGGSCFTPLSFTTEFGLVSNNDISCPLIHQYNPDSVANAADVLSLANYDMQDGSFDLTSVTFPSGMLYRSVTF